MIALAVTTLTLAVCGKALDTAIRYRQRSTGEFTRARKRFRLRRTLDEELSRCIVTDEDSAFRVATRRVGGARADTLVFTRTGTLLPFRREDAGLTQREYEVRRVGYRCVRGAEGFQLVRLEQRPDEQSAEKVPVLDGVKSFALETGNWTRDRQFSDQRVVPDRLRVRIEMVDGTRYEFTCYPVAKYRRKKAE